MTERGVCQKGGLWQADSKVGEGRVCQKGGLWQADSKVGEGRVRGKGPVSPSEGSGEGFLASTLPNTSEADSQRLSSKGQGS